MQIVVNGEVHEVPEGITVLELIERLDLMAGPVAVERNRQIVPRAQHGSEALTLGDQIEIVHFVGGG